MNGMARVEARIFEVQARFGRVAGPAVAPAAPPRTPAPATASSTTMSSTTAGSSFRDLVDAAATRPLASTVATGATRTRAPGTYGKVTLPTEIRGMRNGQLPDSVLEPIGQGEHRLERTAAVAFRRMAAAAAQDGVTLRVSDSYRSLADQTRTVGNVGLYDEGGLAAVPGTSTHGWGLSVDIELDPKAQKWLRSNAAQFGFAEDVAREPWHYTYRPADL